MNKITLLVFFLIAAAKISWAQKGTFVAASANWGISSKWAGEEYGIDDAGWSLNAELGYRFQNNFQISTGLCIIKTAFSNNFNYIIPEPSDYYETFRFKHLMLPLSVGYNFQLSPKLTLTPSVNTGVSYLLSGNYQSETSSSFKEKFNRQTLAANYNEISIWAGTSLQLSYTVNERISLTGSYVFNSMVSNFSKEKLERLGYQKMYVAMAGLGLKYQL